MRTPPESLADALLARAEEILTSDAPRLEDVARLVGTSRAKLYYYFAGQDDLRAFLVEHHLAAGAAVLAEATASPGPAADRLHAAVRAATGYLVPRPGLCAGVLAGAGGVGPLAEALARTDAMIAAPLRALIAEGLADGTLAVADVEAAADGVVGTVLHAVLGRWRRGPQPDAGFAEAVADQVVRGLARR